MKDALGKTERKLDNQNQITKKIVDCYNGRGYKKEVFTPTLHTDWLTIK